MTACWLHVTVALAFSVGLPFSFFSPLDLKDAEGVTIEAQRPETASLLIPADPAHAATSYLPFAALASPQGVLVWYLRSDPERRAVCLGTIREGRWTVPALRQEPVPWGGPNNIAMLAAPFSRSDGNAPLSAFQVVVKEGKLWALYWDRRSPGGEGAYAAVSDKGTDWSPVAENPVFSGGSGIFSLLAREEGYDVYQTVLVPWPDKPHPDLVGRQRRVIARRSSAHLLEWTLPEQMLQPDDRDPPNTEFYAMRPFFHEGRCLALLLKYWADPARPGQLSRKLATELMVSSDGRQWERPFRDADLGIWSFAEPYPSGNRRMFLVARNRSLEQAAYRTRRLTGVVSHASGRFVTPPFSVPGSPVYLDADASQGWIDVEPLDEAGLPLGGVNPCRARAVDSDRIRLDWDGLLLSDLPLVRCRLRISMNQATVYGITADGGSP